MNIRGTSLLIEHLDTILMKVDCVHIFRIVLEIQGICILGRLKIIQAMKELINKCSNDWLVRDIFIKHSKKNYKKNVRNLKTLEIQ